MFHPYNLIIVALVILTVIGVIIYRRSANRNLPISALMGCRLSRVVETIMLVCVSGLLFVFTATNSSTGGQLLQLDELEPAFARANVLVAVIAAALLFVSYIMCWLRRTGKAVNMAVFVLIAYATMLNGPNFFMEAVAGQFESIRKVTWTINSGGCDVEGVELWVNDVNMGPLPLTITPEEFKAKVPYWSEPPAGFDDWENILKVYYYTPWHDSLSGGSGDGWPWHKLVIPDKNVKYGDKEYHPEMEGVKERTYYARLKYGDEWGYTNGGGRSGSGGRYVYAVTNSIDSLRLPQREGRLEKLLDIARASDYAPSDDWYDAIETYNGDGIVAILKLISQEPEMLDLLNRWATWKFKLESVTDADSAWQKFEEICQQVEKSGKFSSSSLTGQAIEMLISKLPADKLVEKAARLIVSTNSYAWVSWKLAGKIYFGYYNSNGSLYTGANNYRGFGRGDQLPIHAYAVAHAVWKMDEYLDAQQPEGDNIIEEKLVPMFIAKNNSNVTILELALEIGGSSLDNYLLRQNWQVEGNELPWRQSYSMFGGNDNGWLYLLSRLDSEAGRKFRREHSDLVFDFYDKYLDNVNTGDWWPKYDFLVNDAGLGTDSLAWQYFPRFCKNVDPDGADSGKLKLQFEYLARMEPYSTPEMYAQCWREFSSSNDELSRVVREFKWQFPEPKRQAISQALQAELDRDMPNIKMSGNNTPEQFKKYLTPMVRDFALEEEYSREDIEKILNSLHAPEDQSGYKAKPEYVRPWLAHANPPHPIMDELIRDPKPELRILILDAIAAHPIPANRKRLDILLNDESELVKTAAQETQKQIADLLKTPLKDLTGLAR